MTRTETVCVEWKSAALSVIFRNPMLPKKITRLRERLGWSMSRLAQELKIDVNFIVDWESGNLFPTKKHSKALQSLEVLSLDESASGAS